MSSRGKERPLPIRSMKKPCMDCPKRHYKCHSHCPDYADFLADVAANKKKMRETDPVEVYIEKKKKQKEILRKEYENE